MHSGEPTATAPLSLVQEITEDRQPGILIYLPLTAPEGQYRGFVYSPIRTLDLFRAAMTGVDLPIELQAFDVAMPDIPLYQTADFEGAAEAERSSAELTLPIAGREWAFAGVPTAAFNTVAGPRFAMLTAIAFALLVIATALAALGQAAAIRRAKALNNEIERRVTQKDFLLREMSHRIKNSIGRTIALVRQSSTSAATKEEFVESVTIRLKAMAAAQDLLVASGTDRADLAALLTSELQQLYGGKVRPSVMRGPTVSLDAQQTLALGLAVHELATNSLKYGAGASPDGELRVTWTIAPEGAERELILEWDEFVPEGARISPGIPSTGTGFGGKLIDACVRTDLRGTVVRYQHSEGLTVEIRFPLV